MKALLLACGTTVLASQQVTPVPAQPPGPQPSGSLLDAQDNQALLLGATTAKAVLAHRTVFRENEAKMRVAQSLKNRWKAIRTPMTLVAVFGSWCSDSQVYLPNLLTLENEANPFIEVHFLGVNRDKRLADTLWPAGCPPQKVHRVPTFFLFATQPGGRLRLVGSVVEGPPRAGQTMAQALVNLVEAAETAP